jgi:hypothetical protein
MGGNQALKDAGLLAGLVSQMIDAEGQVSDERLRKYHTQYEREMIPRGFKWVKASDEGQALFDTDHFGGLLKFWMIICIMNIVEYISMLVFLPGRLLGKAKPTVIEKVESKY